MMDEDPINQLRSSEHNRDATRIFEEVLDAEVYVNLDKVRHAARRGIPQEHRGRLYRFLLGVTPFDKSTEMSVRQQQHEDFATLMPAYATRRGGGTTQAMARDAAWRTAFSSLHNGSLVGHDAARKSRLERVFHAFEVSYGCSVDVASVVRLALPFEAVFDEPEHVFYCTDAMLRVLRSPGNVLESDDSIQNHVSEFLMLFRHTNEELYTHMVNENVNPLEWVPDLLTSLLATHLQLPNLFRLWDLYITDVSAHGSFPLHPFVIFAIFEELTESFIELPGDELMDTLKSLPLLPDMDAILRRAASIKEDVRSQRLTGMAQ